MVQPVFCKLFAYTGYISDAAEAPVAIDKHLALLQTVHAGGQLQPQGRLLGIGKEGDPGFIVRIGTPTAHCFKIQIR